MQDSKPQEPSRPVDRVPADTVKPATGDQAKRPRPRETGGRAGPDPTRYGDWELNGRCIDF